ncbi:MAG: hypothetical protein WA252_15155 [Candidatus Sulfotelmatobacter sp.]
MTFARFGIISAKAIRGNPAPAAIIYWSGIYLKLEKTSKEIVKISEVKIN